MGLGSLGLLDSTTQDFSDVLQGGVAAGVVSDLPSPYLVAPVGKVASLSLLHLCVVCGVAGDSDLLPIWDAVVQGNGKTEGISTRNQALMRGLPSCQ